MAPIIQEWLNLVLRWVHVLAAIMWVGDSFLFMWMDGHLSKPRKGRDGDVVGELWMTHSGGFYEVVKRRSLAKEELPQDLHWFKWESYTTWLSGFVLLGVVYHAGGAALLVDPNVSALSPGQAIGLSLLLLPLSYGLYELLWLTPLRREQRAFGVVGLVLLAGLTWGLTQLFAPRAAFLLVGAALGTIMAANVFFRIVPAQRHMLAMTRAGTPVDTSYGLRAKGRSVQNHYLTLPVLFTMLSSHFPSTWGHPLPWLVLALVAVFGVGLKSVMNQRRRTRPVVWVGTLAALLALGVLTHPAPAGDAALAAYRSKPEVSFATVGAIMDARCVTCHSAQPTSPLFPAAPQGIQLDTPEGVGRHADRVFFRATATSTMPPGNLTGMSTEERELLGAWYAQGARVDAAGPAQLEPAVAPAQAPAAGDVHTRFAQSCAPCHGAGGEGDGPLAGSLTPAPRDFTDAEWQRGVTDEQLRQVLVQGGAAVGKSPLMPGDPSLAEQPELLEELVQLIRSFGAR